MGGEREREAWARESLLLELADPVKLAIVRALSEVDSATLSELGGLTATSRSTLRRHTMAMRAAGLLATCDGESDGTTGRPARRISLSAAARGTVEDVFAAHEVRA